MPRVRPWKPGCQLCHGKGVAFLLTSEGRRGLECPECFPPPTPPPDEHSVAARAPLWLAEFDRRREEGLRAALDAVREARGRGEA